MDELRNAAVAANLQRQVSASLGAHDSRSSSPSQFSRNSTPPPDALISGQVGVQRRKRRAQEDMSAYSRAVGREFKLRKCDRDELDKFSRLAPEKQSIWLAGKLLRVSEHQEAQVAPEVVFVLQPALKGRITRLCVSLVIDSSTTAYIEPDSANVKTTGPALAIFKKVCDNPSWGFTHAMSEDTTKTNILMKRIQDVLTKKRSALKRMVDDSLGRHAAKPVKDITELAEDVASLQSRRTVPVTVQLCVRLAIIRSVAAIEPPIAGKAFWPRIDEELKKNRAMTLAEQSFLLNSILKLDMEKYGNGEDSLAGIEKIREANITCDDTTQDDGAEDVDGLNDSDSEFDELDEN